MTQNKTVKTHEAGFPLWTKITAFLLVINVVIALVGSYIVYPTQAHRDVSRQLTDMSQRFVTDDGQPVYETAAYKQLESTSEASYMAAANVAIGVVDFVITIILTGAVYRYLRKNRLSKNHKEVGVTVLTSTVAVVLGWALTLPLVAQISGAGMPSTGMIVFQLVAITLISMLIFFIIARIFEWQYNRKHSLVVE
ncbi:MAG: hypothetical protein WBP22_04935 [Candidatus Saccharimonas sp.]